MTKKRMSGTFLKNFFIDRKIKHKMALVYTIAGIFPILFILSITYVQMKSILRDNEIETVNSYLYQASASMENQLQIYNNLSNYIAYNQTLSQVLSYDYTSNYDRYNQIVTILDPMISSLMYFHNEVSQVTIYADNGLVKHGTTIAPLSELEEEEWASEVLMDTKIHWYVDQINKKAFSATKVASLSRYNMEGILYVSLDYDALFQAFDQSIINNYGVYILDSENHEIYSGERFGESYKSYFLSLAEFLKLLDTDNKQYQILSMDSEATGWTIYLYKPEALMISSMQPIVRIAVLTSIVCLFAFGMGGFMITKYVTSRITSLRSSMKEVEKGNLDIQIRTDSKDEIGDLISGFGKMLRRLRATMDAMYHSKIKEKEYEMRALQAQINPHFLYNTLSLINWKALDVGEKDISKITLSLSTFYRTSLNKGKNIMSVSDEIDNIKSYLNIQLMMHDHDFDTEIDIADEILSCRTLNLILQPLVENAIDHGIDLMKEGRGKVTIQGFAKDGEVYLLVHDNGVGMTEEQAMKILTEDSKGYGVRNVNERIKLFYGEKYALKITSVIGEGTTVMVHFPNDL